MLGFLGKLFTVFLAAVAALAGVGWWQTKRNPGGQEDEILSQKTVDNVLDLNDRFNRARYMDEDGK